MNPHRRRGDWEDDLDDAVEAFAQLPEKLLSVGLRSLKATADIVLSIGEEPTDILEVPNRGRSGIPKRPKRWTDTSLEKMRNEPFLFLLDPSLEKYLNENPIATELCKAFQAQGGITLSADTQVVPLGAQWHIIDGDQVYPVVRQENGLAVYLIQYVDPDVDRAIKHYFEKGDFKNQGKTDREKVQNLFGYLSGRAALADGVFDEIDSFFQPVLNKIVHLPTWMDQSLMQTAEEVFHLYETEYMAVLVCRSLPETYACWRGAQALALAGTLAGFGIHPQGSGTPDALLRRVLVTTQFVLDVMKPGAFSQGPEAGAVPTVQKLRLIHGAIRYFLSHDARWNPAWGCAINQEDMAMTLLAFSIIAIDGLRRINIHLDPDREAAIYHRWRVVGFLLGIHDALLPETVEEAWQLWHVIVARQQMYRQGAPTMEEAQKVHRLTSALVGYMQSIVPFPVPGYVPEYLIRYQVSDTVANHLGLRQIKRPELRVMTYMIRLGLRLGETIENSLPILSDAIQTFNRDLFDQIVRFWNLGQPIHFYIPQALPGANALLFNLPLENAGDLDSGRLTKRLRQSFKSKQFRLPPTSRVLVVRKGIQWAVGDGSLLYTILKETDLVVYGNYEASKITAGSQADATAETVKPKEGKDGQT